MHARCCSYISECYFECPGFTSLFRTMPPLRSAPLSQRFAPTCGELYFCQCWDCESHETIIPGTVANLVRGRYLPYAQFSKHQTSLKLSGLAVYSQQATDPSPGPQEGRVEAKEHQPRHVKPAKKSQTSNEELEAYCSQLRSFQRRAAQIPEIALSVRPAFKTVAGSPYAPSCLVLDPSAPENSAILEYEMWLPQVSNFVQYHPLRQKTHKSSLLSTLVLRAIERSFSDIDAWKRRWMRHHHESDQDKDQDKSNNVIDTCKSVLDG